MFNIFAGYEWSISEKKIISTLEPVFPWLFVRNRAWMGMVIIAFFHGVAWVVPIYQIPQRMEVIYNVSPLGGGVRLLPFMIMALISSIVMAVLAKKGAPSIYLLLFSACLQIIGFVCLAPMPYSTDSGILARQYGFEIIASVECGPMTVLLPLIAPYTVEARDRGVGMAAITEARMMGGVMGLSVVTTAMNNLFRLDLHEIPDDDTIEAILESPRLINGLSPAAMNSVRTILNEGFSL